jgi:hypothetical protein
MSNHFIVVHNEDISDFVAEIHRFDKEGYVCVGGMSTTSHVYKDYTNYEAPTERVFFSQLMVKEVQ